MLTGAILGCGQLNFKRNLRISENIPANLAGDGFIAITVP
jgi:hypothetical protein